MPRPTDIEYDRAARVLTVTWDEGPKSVFTLGYLRGWCPCAGCQGHGDVTRWLGDFDVGASDLAEVGSYAIQITFSDGHDGGIYSWDWLHRISEHVPPLGPKRGAFRGGRFVES